MGAAVLGEFAGAPFDDDLSRLPLERFFTLDASVSGRLTEESEVFVAAEPP